MADGPFTFHGQHYQVTDLDGEPKPVQRPHPPIVIGGGGPKILALAAEHAQIVGINANLRSGQGESTDSLASLSAQATDAKLERLRTAAGDRFDELEIQTLTGFVHVTDDRRSMAEAIASGMGAPDAEVALQTPALLVGTTEQIVEEVRARRDRWQMSYVVVDEDATDAFAPVVAELAGT
jgi:alkanesulfonate monooxygenase SsuD/methylene tetrahydromethanopterin reductase-like flavin-dependent oxidoreductase (luciferase family)